MVDSRKRATASLKVKYKSATLGQFTQQFGLDISHGGIFIKTKSALEPGALIRLELQLSDGTPVIQGSGRVKWRRNAGPEAALPAGMGIEFIRLEASSRALVDRICDAREGRPSRFEQSDGADLLSASQPLASTLASSHPPRPLASAPPIPTVPPAAPAASASVRLPAPPPPAGPTVSAAPPAFSKAPPPAGEGLFANSGLRAGSTVMPGPAAPGQGSFFSTTHSASSPRHPVVQSVPKPAPLPAFSSKPPADVEARSGAARPPSKPAAEAEDDVTGQFRERALFTEESAVTSQRELSGADAQPPGELFHDESAVTAPLGRAISEPSGTHDDISDSIPFEPIPDAPPAPEPALPAQASHEGSPPPGPAQHAWEVAGPGTLSLGLSSLQPPPRSKSTTLVWVIVVALALIAGAIAFVMSRRTPASSHSRSETSDASDAAGV